MSLSLKKSCLTYSIALFFLKLEVFEAQTAFKTLLSLFSLLYLGLAKKTEEPTVLLDSPSAFHYKAPEQLSYKLDSVDRDPLSLTSKKKIPFSQVNEKFQEEKYPFQATNFKPEPLPRSQKEAVSREEKLLGTAGYAMRRLRSSESALFFQQTVGGSSLNARFFNHIDSHDHKGYQVLVHECSFLSNPGILPCVTLIGATRQVVAQGVYGDGFNTELYVDFTEITSTDKLLVVCRLDKNLVNFWVQLPSLSIVGDPTRVTEDRYVAYGLSLAFYNNDYHFVLGLNQDENVAVGMNFKELRTRYTLVEKIGEFYNLGPPIYGGLITREIVHYTLSNNGKGRCTLGIMIGNSFIMKHRSRIDDPKEIYGLICIHMGIEKKSNKNKYYYVATQLFPLNSSSTSLVNGTAIFYLSSEKDPTVRGVRPIFKNIVYQNLLEPGHRDHRFLSIKGDSEVYMVSIYNNSHLHMNRFEDGAIIASSRYSLLPHYPLSAATRLKKVRYVASKDQVVATLQSGPRDSLTIHLPLAGSSLIPPFSVNQTLTSLLPLSGTTFSLIKQNYNCELFSCIGFTFVYPSTNFGAPYPLQRLLSSYDLGIINFYTASPTISPTEASLAPSNAPTLTTIAPTRYPTAQTGNPTLPPTAAPTTSPTVSPTFASGKNVAIYRINFPEVKSFFLVDFQNLDAQNKALFISLRLEKDENRAQLLFINELGRIEEDNSRLYRMDLFSEIYPASLYPDLSGGLSSTQAFIAYDGAAKIQRVRFYRQDRSGRIKDIFQLKNLPVSGEKIAWRSYNTTHQFAYMVVEINEEQLYLLLCGFNFFDGKSRVYRCQASSEKYHLQPVGDILIVEEQACGLFEAKKFRDSSMGLLYYCWHMNKGEVSFLEVKENYPLLASAILPYDQHNRVVFLNLGGNQQQLSSIQLMTISTRTHHLNCSLQHRRANISYAAASRDEAGNWYLVGQLQKKILLIQLKGCYAGWSVLWPLPYLEGIKVQFDPSSPAIMRMVVPEKKALYYTYFYLTNGSNHLWQGAPVTLRIRERYATFSYQTRNDISFRPQHINIEGASIRTVKGSLAQQMLETKRRGNKKESQVWPIWAVGFLGAVGGLLFLLAISGSLFYYYYKKKKIRFTYFNR